MLIAAATEGLLGGAPMQQIAIACAVAAAAGCTWFGFGAWRAWRRFSLTQEAALALVDAHRSSVEATAVEVSAGMARGAERSAHLLRDVVELRHDVDVLKWMVGRIPYERDRLRRELIDRAFPTDARDRTDAARAADELRRASRGRDGSDDGS